MTFDLTPYRSIYPFESKFFERNGIKMHYLDEGNGSPIVMVHGNPTWSFMFRNLILELRHTHRIIAPDHIGCGLSDKPSDNEYSYRLVNRIDDLEALLENLGIRNNISLVIHDWGGAIGMGYAVRHPERINKILILNSAAFFLPAKKTFPWPLYFFRNFFAGELITRMFNAFSEITVRVAVRKPLPELVRKAYTAPYNSWNNRIATIRFVQDIPLVPQDPSYQEIMNIQKGLAAFANRPILICWGLKDFVFDKHFLKEWKVYFPNAKVHAFKDAGHFVLEDAWFRLKPIIREFF